MNGHTMTPSLDSATIPLRDIHLPPPPAWWPPAPGWWLLAVVLIVVPIALLWVTHARRRGALRRAARRELEHLRGLRGEPPRLAAEAALLLRRVSLALDPQHRHVTLTGDAWLERVRAIAPGFEDPSLAAALLRAPYAPTEVDPARLLGALERWVGALPASTRRLRQLATTPAADV